MKTLRLILPVLVLTVLSCGGPRPEFIPGPLGPSALASAAAAEGFRAVSLESDIPVAVHPLFPFHYYEYGDSFLVELRKRFPLDSLVAGASDEWEAQCRLKHWIAGRITNGTPSAPGDDAIQVLENSARGATYWCSYYALTCMETAQALGWTARKLGIDRWHGQDGHESAHHGVAEIWSNQFRKWVVLDCQSDLHYEKDGVPLSAWEIRTEWLKNGGEDVSRVVGAPERRELKNPAIVWWDRPNEDETAVYFWIYYAEDSRNWDEELPGRYIFPQDSANAGRVWYQNGPGIKGRLHTGYEKKLFLPSTDPAAFDWTVGLVEAQATALIDGRLHLELDSYCPNLSGFEAEQDGGEWKTVEGKSFDWPLHKGANSLALRTVNAAGVRGAALSACVDLEK